MSSIEGLEKRLKIMKLQRQLRELGVNRHHKKVHRKVRKVRKAEGHRQQSTQPHHNIFNNPSLFGRGIN